MDRWFICQNEKVTGPYTGDEIKAQVAGSQIPSGCLIWGRPLNQWHTVESWVKESLTPASTATAEHAVTSTTANDNSIATNQPQWHYAIDGASKGPLTRVELINELREVKNKMGILVWTKGMKAWADLYDFHDLLDDLGLNRREHSRATITGQVVIKTEDNTSYIGQLKTISQGGFGAVGIDASLSIGQTFHVEIKSEHLGDSISAKAVVQYLTDEQFYGCRFLTINMEARARITEYIIKLRQSMGVAA